MTVSMTRQEIITELGKYFQLRELVCPHTYKAFGERSWQFMDTELLHTLLIIRRDILKCGMVINDYPFGGKNTQRGLRCNICPLVAVKTKAGLLYLSAHCNGAAIDAVFGQKSGMTAAKARQLIEENKDLLPYNIRLEGGVSWLHIDCYDTGKKVHTFTV